MKLNWNNWKTWLCVACILVVLILFFVGFLAGYFWGDKSCFEDPFTYGIKEMNKFNDDEFSCFCNSQTGTKEFFSFDKNGFIKDFLQ